MYCDDFDFQGLMYWYNEAKEISESMNKKK